MENRENDPLYMCVIDFSRLSSGKRKEDGYFRKVSLG